MDAAVDSAPGAKGETGEGGGPVSSFARDVHPLLAELCARCHGPNGQASNTALVLSADAGRDLTQVRRFLNQDNPAASRLLIKAAGSGHGGGAIIATGTDEHRTILEWISQGSAP